MTFLNAHISARFDVMKDNYLFRPLTGPFKDFMDHTPGTPCCVQLSHSLNKAELLIDEKSYRRRNSWIKEPGGGGFYYMLAVDEVENFLRTNFGPGKDVRHDEDGKPRGMDDIKTVINGRTGILVFGTMHVELWDKDDILQKDMNRGALFAQARVLFWEVGLILYEQDGQPEEAYV